MYLDGQSVTHSLMNKLRSFRQDLQEVTVVQVKQGLTHLVHTRVFGYGKYVSGHSATHFETDR